MSSIVESDFEQRDNEIKVIKKVLLKSGNLGTMKYRVTMYFLFWNTK